MKSTNLARSISTQLLVDVHTHMYDKKLVGHIDQIVEDAQMNQVHKIIVVSEDAETAQQVLSLCERYPSVLKPSIGLHPCSVHSREQIQEMVNLIRTHKEQIVCIGEVGLDYSPNILKDTAQRYNTTPDALKELQKEALIEFCKLSEETGLSLNVHSRSAGRPCIKLLQDNGARKVLMHCFDGSVKVAKQAIQSVDSQFFFSIPANICRSNQLQELAKALPLERLMLETDSPALLPNLPDHETKEELEMKLKTARNEPKNAILSCEKIAELKQIPMEVVGEQTTNNARILFPRIFNE